MKLHRLIKPAILFPKIWMKFFSDHWFRFYGGKRFEHLKRDYSWIITDTLSNFSGSFMKWKMWVFWQKNFGKKFNQVVKPKFLPVFGPVKGFNNFFCCFCFAHWIEHGKLHLVLVFWNFLTTRLTTRSEKPDFEGFSSFNRDYSWTDQD